jgi:hypothetical protein
VIVATPRTQRKQLSVYSVTSGGAGQHRMKTADCPVNSVYCRSIFLGSYGFNSPDPSYMIGLNPSYDYLKYSEGLLKKPEKLG